MEVLYFIAQWIKKKKNEDWVALMIQPLSSGLMLDNHVGGLTTR